MARKVRAERIPSIYVAGVLMEAGMYLPSQSGELVEKKPDKDEGYAHFDGETLTLRNFVYIGPGRRIGSMNVGIDVSNATTEIVFKGDCHIHVNTTGQEMNCALLVNDGKVSISGRGELSLNADGSHRCNFGVYGNGALKITSGTTRLFSAVGDYTVDEDGRRIYGADSYAMKVEKFSAPLARIRGRDDEEDEEDGGTRKPDEKNESGEMNRNNETEVIIDFPKIIFWWWRRGCLLQGLLGLLALLALLLAIWGVFFREPDVLEPDFALLEIEENAEEMPDEGKAVTSSAGGGSVVLNYKYDVQASLSTRRVDLYFGMPSRSNRDAVLQLVVGNQLLAQSGRLPPGYQVSRLTLREDAVKRLREGVYKGELRVLYYNDETGERAILDTKIEVDIAVTN